MKRKRDDRVFLPYVLVEEILLRLPVKSLLRFTSVSREWNSTIISQYFASEHLIRPQSRNPDILLCGAVYHDEDDYHEEPYSYLRTLVLGSSDSEKIHILPEPSYCQITLSCDGLVCAYNLTTMMYLINPATRWHRSLPLAKLQQFNSLRQDLNLKDIPLNCLGLGKDLSTGKYKLVWLYNDNKESFYPISYNSSDYPTCEVFDFNTNTWRYVPGATHAIRDRGRPVYADGSLYWFIYEFTDEEKMLCFDLQTEVFQIMSDTPITIHALPENVTMNSLNSRLCVSVAATE